AQVAIVGGADSKLSIFQVDGKENRKIQTIAVENFPIFSAELNVPEDEIIIGSMFPTFVMYNMDVGKITRTSQVRNTKLFTVSPDGKLMVLVGTFGHVHVLSIKSKGLLQTLKSESESIEAVTFSSDGEMLFTHSSDGVVYVWNMKTFKCMFKFQDEGCTQGTTIHISSNTKYLATGSHTGVVNLYETSSLLSMPSNSTKFCLPQPKPIKAIPNITTTCTAVKFNENSELLAMASNYAEGSVKLFHTRSLSVLANFPNPAKPLGIPYSLDFSPNSGYFSVGNHHGVAHLFR
ncbi:hypothetical protein HELRODRAFT_150704, partial [Helobdella robusta]|uniref:Uncharacterized protein n=1 Tax=Helobdella robusta TaxID=6412 RepID=T1EKH1_HELRO